MCTIEAGKNFLLYTVWMSLCPVVWEDIAKDHFNSGKERNLVKRRH